MLDSLQPHGLYLCQAPLSMGFSRQEYRSRLPFHTPGDLPNPGIKPESPASTEFAGGFFTTSTIWEAHLKYLSRLQIDSPVLDQWL